MKKELFFTTFSPQSPNCQKYQQERDACAKNKEKTIKNNCPPISRRLRRLKIVSQWLRFGAIMTNYFIRNFLIVKNTFHYFISTFFLAIRARFKYVKYRTANFSFRTRLIFVSLSLSLIRTNMIIISSFIPSTVRFINGLLTSGTIIVMKIFWSSFQNMFSFHIIIINYIFSMLAIKIFNQFYFVFFNNFSIFMFSVYSALTRLTITYFNP